MWVEGPPIWRYQRPVRPYSPRMLRRLLPGIVAFSLLAACGKKEDPTPLAPSASALAASNADPASAAWHYTVDSKSTTHVDMPGLNEHIVGDTAAAAGTLDVVAARPRAVAGSREDRPLDVRDAHVRQRARRRSDEARAHVARGGGRRQDERGHALGRVRDPVDRRPERDRPREGRPGRRTATTTCARVTMTVHGELRIHGHKVQKDEAGGRVLPLSFGCGRRREAGAHRGEVEAAHPRRPQGVRRAAARPGGQG